MSIINARTILLVDDEEVQIILFSKLLTKIGYNVIQAYSGKQALEEVQNNKVDIVLLDISLDDRFDGLELAEEILKIIDLPIIFLSNYRTREIISKTEIISSYGFIPKGSELAIIENTVNTALKLFEFQKREKEINQKLKENEYRLKLAQASGNIGVWDLDIQTGKIVWDEKMHELYHSEENSQISLQIWEEKIHKDDLNSFKDTFNKSIDENLNINTEFRIITPEGKTKYIESYGTLLYSNKNEPTRIIGINIDVTKKKRTKIKLEKNKRKYKNLLDSLQEGIWAINKEGFTTFTNENFEKMLGFTKEEMKNKHILDFIEDSKKEFIKENIKRRQEGIKEELEFEFIKKTGEKIITLVATAPILDENYNYDGAIAGIIDITDRKINELKIANLLTSKEIILKEVHHRIKNNMSNIIGILNIERSRIDNPKIDSILMDIESRIMNMMKLYETLYISDDYQNVSTEKFFNSLIDQIIDNFNILNNITVEKSIEDKKLSFQTTNCLGVISNEIIINTIKYAFDPNQKGSINYRLSFQENQGCLVIGDNGRGIPSETASHGFGTTLIKMMVKQIKGDVEINNSNGTEYKICFPFEENFT